MENHTLFPRATCRDGPCTRFLPICVSVQASPRVPAQRVKDLDGLDGGSGWGLLAARDAPAGTTLVTLPDKCLFTFDEADTASPLGQLIQKVPEELWVSVQRRATAQRAAHRSPP